MLYVCEIKVTQPFNYLHCVTDALHKIFGKREGNEGEWLIWSIYSYIGNKREKICNLPSLDYDLLSYLSDTAYMTSANGEDNVRAIVDDFVSFLQLKGINRF